MDTKCFSQNFIDSMTSEGYDMDTSVKVTTKLLDEAEVAGKSR